VRKTNENVVMPTIIVDKIQLSDAISTFCLAPLTLSSANLQNILIIALASFDAQKPNITKPFCCKVSFGIKRDCS
jgi:hypothetical protein